MLVAHHALERPFGSGVAATRRLLARLRCIQLDPLDPLGTNADLVAMARVDGLVRGDVYRHLFPHHAFEHFAKERCILPSSAFPWYRQRGHTNQAPWWRHTDRESRVSRAAVEAVLAEVRERGAVSARELTDHGDVEAIDWSGWKGTGRATTMALEILWTRCDLVVCGRDASGNKRYDLPSRALGGDLATREPRGEFERWALLDRVAAAGLLSRAGGAQWSMLGSVRTSSLPDMLLEAGELVEVTVEGSSRRYLTTAQFLNGGRRPRYDDRVRILAPLDPLLWDRELVRTAFGFRYSWEVYKPAEQRIWGWYVCPLLHRDQLIGRLDARIDGRVLRVAKLWLEPGVATDREAIVRALESHAERCGASAVRLPRRWPSPTPAAARTEP